MRHFGARVVADQHRAGECGFTETMTYLVDCRVDTIKRQRLRLAERQYQLLGTAAVDTRHREADQSQSTLCDQGSGRRDQPPGDGQDGLRRRRGPRQGA